MLYAVSAKSIYTWLRESVVDGNRNLILENNRLKKELEMAYRLLGRATAEMSRQKRAILDEVEPGWREQFVKRFKVGRTSYYRTATIRQQKDKDNIATLAAIHAEYPFYGVARLALALGWSETKTRRIRSLAGITIQTRTKKRRTSRYVSPEIPAPANALAPYAVLKNESRPQDGLDYSSMTNSAA